MGRYSPASEGGTGGWAGALADTISRLVATGTPAPHGPPRSPRSAATGPAPPSRLAPNQCPQTTRGRGLSNHMGDTACSSGDGPCVGPWLTGLKEGPPAARTRARQPAQRVGLKARIPLTLAGSGAEGLARRSPNFKNFTPPKLAPLSGVTTNFSTSSHLCKGPPGEQAAQAVEGAQRPLLCLPLPRHRGPAHGCRRKARQ